MTAERALTEKRLSILSMIATYTEVYGYPPSIREIGSAVGIKSTSSVLYQLRKLEETGDINRGRDISRAIALPKINS